MIRHLFGRTEGHQLTTFAKAEVSLFYDSEVLNSSILHLIQFNSEKPRLRNATKR
jgi:hypothetical protein